MSIINRKRTFLVSFFFWLLFAVFIQAAEPAGLINYQGRLLDKYGRRVNVPVEITFRIFNGKDELLWSEKHGAVPVTDGLYSTVLGSIAPLPASIFEGDELYFEIDINGETLTPRQRITASPYALTARTVNGPDLNVASNGNVGIGAQTPEEKLDVKGTVQATGFKMPTGASAGYVLVSDGNGVGQWRPVSSGGVTAETDPIHTNWVRVAFAPATNDLWAAIKPRAMQSDVSAATNALWTEIDSRVLAATYNVATGNLWTAIGVLHADFSAATNELWNAINTRLPLSNGVMTSPLIVSNNMAVAGSATWRPGSQTIADNITTIQVAQAFARIGADGGVLRNFSGCARQIAPGNPGQTLIIQTTNSCVRLNDGKGVKLAGGVNFFMGANDTIQLIYDGENWVEIQRTDN